MTLLIVGLGKAGQAVAALAKAFGITVIGTRAHPRSMDKLDHVGSANE
jgi:phosphoglycerate dehydrogenase-like enzyme